MIYLGNGENTTSTQTTTLTTLIASVSTTGTCLKRKDIYSTIFVDR